MTLFYYNPLFLEHDTGNHPEHANRLRTVMGRLRTTDFFSEMQQPDWLPASLDQLLQVHSSDSITEMESFINRGGGQIEADTIVSLQSLEAARMGSGAACDAVHRVVAGEARNAFCLIRPPGHHALKEHPMGFCLVNHVAVAARELVKQHGLERVMIVDWDVHHGNGTQAAFWEDSQVAFLSMHRSPFYPGGGDAHETGAGDGQGLNVNLPVQFGTSAVKQIDRFKLAAEKLAADFKPQFILVSAGFDSHHADPVGGNGLESSDFEALTRIMMDIADVHSGGRLVSLLEGGYNPDALAESVEFHLRTLLDRRL
ncbi:histone deacetylase [Rhodopirellula sp.]|nr:histone deacetylase [Rhodopirellula sp.]